MKREDYRKKMEADRQLRREMELDPPPNLINSPYQKRKSTMRGVKKRTFNLSREKEKETPIDEWRRKKRERKASEATGKDPNENRRRKGSSNFTESISEPKKREDNHPEESSHRHLDSGRLNDPEGVNPSYLISKSPNSSWSKAKDTRQDNSRRSHKKKFDTEKSERPKIVSEKRYKEEPADIKKYTEQVSSKRMINKQKNVRIKGITSSMEQDSFGSLDIGKTDTLPESEVERQRKRISEQLKLKDRQRKRRDKEKREKEKKRKEAKLQKERSMKDEKEETFDERAKQMQTNEFIRNFEISMDRDTSYSDNMNTEDMINQEEPRRRIVNMTDMPQISPSRFRKQESQNEKNSEQSSNQVMFIQQNENGKKISPKHSMKKKKREEPLIPEKVPSTGRRPTVPLPFKPLVDGKQPKLNILDLGDSLSNVNTTKVILRKDNARLQKDYENVGNPEDLARPKGLGKPVGFISARNTPKRRDDSENKTNQTMTENTPKRFGKVGKRDVPTFEERTREGGLEESRKRRFYAGETPKQEDASDSEEEMEYYERAYSEDKDLNLEDSEHPHEFEYTGDPNLQMTSVYRENRNGPNPGHEISKPKPRKDSQEPNTTNVEIEPHFPTPSQKQHIKSEDYIDKDSKPEDEIDTPKSERTKDLNIPGYNKREDDSDSEDENESNHPHEFEIPDNPPKTYPARPSNQPESPNPGEFGSFDNYDIENNTRDVKNKYDPRDTQNIDDSEEFNLREDSIGNEKEAFQEPGGSNTRLFNELMSNPNIAPKSNAKKTSSFSRREKDLISKERNRGSDGEPLAEIDPPPLNAFEYDDDQETPHSDIKIPQIKESISDSGDLLNRDVNETPGLRTGSLSGTDTRLTTPSQRESENRMKRKPKSPKETPKDFSKKKNPQHGTDPKLNPGNVEPLENPDSMKSGRVDSPKPRSRGNSKDMANPPVPTKNLNFTLEKQESVEPAKKPKEMVRIEESNLDFLNSISSTPNMKTIRKSNRKKRRRKKPANARPVNQQNNPPQSAQPNIHPNQTKISSSDQIPPVQSTPVHNPSNYPSPIAPNLNTYPAGYTHPNYNHFANQPNPQDPNLETSPKSQFPSHFSPVGGLPLPSYKKNSDKKPSKHSSNGRHQSGEQQPQFRQIVPDTPENILPPINARPTDHFEISGKPSDQYGMLCGFILFRYWFWFCILS